MSKWKVCCQNLDCMRKHNYREFEFEPPKLCPIDNKPWEKCEHVPWDREVKLRCPECGSDEHLAPAWIKKYRFQRETETLEKLRELDERLARLREGEEVKQK